MAERTECLLNDGRQLGIGLHKIWKLIDDYRYRPVLAEIEQDVHSLSPVCEMERTRG